jgi:hypothetical protein
MFNVTNMFNILSVFNHEWFNKFTAPREQWSNFLQNKPSLKKLTDLASDLSQLSSPETAFLNLKNLRFGQWTDLFNNLPFSFLQSLNPKINNSLKNSFRRSLFGLLPSLFLGFSGLFI